MRLLSEWRDYDRQGFSRQESKGHGKRNSGRNVARPLPLLHAHTHASRNWARETGDGAMKNPSPTLTEIPVAQGAADALARAGFSRRTFMKGTGALIVSFSMGGVSRTLDAQQTRAGAFGEPAASGSPPANEVDSWIAIASDSSVTAYTGKEQLGQGMSTAQMQLVAQQLCVPF